MNWTHATIVFPARLFEPSEPPVFREDALEEFFGRYMTNTSIEEQFLDGVPVTLSPAEPDFVMAAVFPDDAPLTRFRKASVYDGTLPMPPVEGGVSIECWWNPQFLADIAAPPAGDEALFEGVRVLPASED